MRTLITRALMLGAQRSNKIPMSRMIIALNVLILITTAVGIATISCGEDPVGDGKGNAGREANGEYGSSDDDSGYPRGGGEYYNPPPASRCDLVDCDDYQSCRSNPDCCGSCSRGGGEYYNPPPASSCDNVDCDDYESCSSNPDCCGRCGSSGGGEYSW